MDAKNDKEALFEKIRKCLIMIPKDLSPECQDLLAKLFEADPDKRLGGGPRDVEEIKEHNWFKGIDWQMIHDKSVRPPFKPKLQSELDTKYIDTMFTQQMYGTPESEQSLTTGSLAGGKWEGFTYKGEGYMEQ